DVRRLDLVEGGVVVERERPGEGERLADEVDGGGPVLARVELVVADVELQLAAVDPALAVDVARRRLGAQNGALEDAGHGPRQRGDVADGDRVGGHADIGGPTVAPGRRGSDGIGGGTLAAPARGGAGRRARRRPGQTAGDGTGGVSGRARARVAR